MVEKYSARLELILQLSIGAAVFLYCFYSLPLRQELLFTAFLLYAIIVFLAPLFRNRLFLRYIDFLSPVLILGLGLFYPVILFAAPAVLIPLTRHRGWPAPWVFLLSLVPLVFLSGPYIGYYLIISFSVLLMHLSAGGIELSLRRAVSRVYELEQEMEHKDRLVQTLEREAQNIEILSAMEERDRISTALHDRLGHLITGSIMQLQAAETLADQDQGRSLDCIRRTRDTLSAGMDDIRTILKKEVPLDEEVGLRRIRRGLDEFSFASGFETRVIISGPVATISVKVWTAIHRALNEAVTNASKYSTGNSFSCRIEVFNKLIRAEFKDNGSPGGKIVYGMGLKGMESRIAVFGGTMLVDNSDGFSITLLFPRGEGKGQEK